MANESISKAVNLQSLRKVERLKSPNLVDHYFCCTAHGTVIQWGINSTSSGGYGINDVGDAVVSIRSNYNYTTTLIYARNVLNKTELKSIMIISAFESDELNLILSCNNNDEIDFASTNENPTYNEYTDSIKSTAQVALDYVLSFPILQQNSTLHIFVCGTNSSSQNVGTTIRAVGFTAMDEIGIARKVLSTDTTMVSLLAILSSRSPFETTSFVFVTMTTNFSLICSFGNNMVQLQSEPEFPVSTTSPTLTTRSNSPTEDLPTTSLPLSGSCLHIFIIVDYVALMSWHCLASREQNHVNKLGSTQF